MATDTAGADGALAELLSLLPELPERVHEAFHGLIDTPEGLKRLVALDVSPGSTFTGEMVIRLDPTDGLRMFLAAVRTGEFEDSIVEDAFGHIPSLQPDRDRSSVSRGERIAQ
ncbi:MAG TPA: hypothetical protein VND94_00795 [Terriglobia bacterium]|nr:hypothetical protein [Terriglobia bacterium]